MIKIFFETSPDMLALLDQDGKVIDCNTHYVESLGYQKDELIGMVGPIDFVVPRDRQRAVSAFEEVVVKGVKRNVPLEVVRKDGSTFASIWSGAVLRNVDSSIEGYLVTGKDLSEVENLKSQIKETKEQGKKEKMVLLGQLTSRLAHDIKNPLNVLQMGIQMLRNKEVDLTDSQIQERLGIFEKNISRISTQIDYVLDFIRERPIQRQKLNLKDCISESIKNITIPDNVQINAKHTDIQVYGDSFLLGIVFTNLLTNSVQSFNGRPGTITIRASAQKHYTIIEVEDSGPGIDPKVLPVIFEPLVTTKQRGTGLGLVSCKSIIENHGGIIFAKNNPTTFTIKLPKEIT